MILVICVWEIRVIGNQIRLHRTRLGITQADLAARLGTTAATISRLETGDVSLSLDWLNRIAEALGLAWTDLAGEPPAAGLEFLGLLGTNGLVMQAGSGAGNDLALALPAEGGVAVRLIEAQGRYSAGDILVARRTDAPVSTLVGHECLVQPVTGPLVVGRVLAGSEDLYTVVPAPPLPVLEAQRIAWAAALLTRITPL